MDTERDVQIQKVLTWNKVWMSLLILFAIGWGVFSYFRNLVRQVTAVKTSWHSETLVINSISGHMLITALVGRSPKGTPVGARLPNPIFLLDSEGAKIERSDFQKLEWRNEGRSVDQAAAIESEIRALFVRLELSEWKDWKDGGSGID